MMIFARLLAGFAAGLPAAIALVLVGYLQT